MRGPIVDRAKELGVRAPSKMNIHDLVEAMIEIEVAAGTWERRAAPAPSSPPNRFPPVVRLDNLRGY